MFRNLALSILVLILASLACNLPQPTPEIPTVIVVTATPLPATNTPVASPSPIPTLPIFNTPTFAPTATSIPCNIGDFITDVTYSDNTQVPTGSTFVKTWRIKNAGTCTWTTAYQLVFETGERMEGPATQALTGSVAPGQTLDLSVSLKAPATPGTYRGYWMLREPGGTLFGVENGHFWVQIVAVKQAPFLPDWPTLSQNASGPEVWALQYLLRVRGQNITADGLFGPNTRAAVVGFQTSVGLPPDGIVGAQTWSALIAGLQYSQNANSEGVRAIQTLLHDKFGETNLAIDGVFGALTTEAVKNFQEAYGLKVDGIVGPDTWQALIGY